MTVMFPLLQDNSAIQYFQLEHERYRAVGASSWTEGPLVGQTS